MIFASVLLYIFLFLSLSINSIISQGKVYLVLGSDTAIWDGMSVSRFNCTYNPELFTSTSSNTAVVMSETFRNNIVDSYGNKLKLTWWMMAGNIFRYATNNNVPVNNIMTLHLMKKYFGDKIEQWGDELSLHYHTFSWTDYDGDGIYWWNQTQTFPETRDDFDFTLAQFLLEENIFPVSFRSGWHYMDNAWQNYLNEILPYSLHNDWPAVRYTTVEPIDNVFDWSQSSPEFVPFNPDPENYQLQGNSKGWNVRSKYMGNVTQQMVNDIFMKADQGTDQLVCFWSHLPDQSFLNEIQHVNNLVQQVSANYPDVDFIYCTAVEAYQLWLQSNDSIIPDLQLTEQRIGNEVKFRILTNEPIFQTQPFVAIKDRYERYIIAECENLSPNTWRTVSSFPLNDIGKAGAAVTDTAGNLSTAFINYLPDDHFIDNGDPEYSEVSGTWTTSNNAAWNLDSRISVLNPGDSAKVRWVIESGFSGLHNIFVQFPEEPDHTDTIYFEFYKNGLIEDTTIVQVLNEFNKWLYVTSVDLNSGENNFIEMSAKNNSQISMVLTADVLKISAYVRERQLLTSKQFIDLGEVSIEDSVHFNIEVTNAGINNLTIENIYSVDGNIIVNTQLPFTISGMSNNDLSLTFIPDELGSVEDTLVIISNDPINPAFKIPFAALVLDYFVVVDNDDAGAYSETGTWFTSVTQAYGNSSRYAFIQSTPNGPTAAFTFSLNKNGLYDIFEILPSTVNSANNALYKIISDGNLIDSFYLNQNEGSGSWKNIGQYYLKAGVPTSVKVIDSGESSSGPVIRADAFKIALFEEITDIKDHDVLTYPTEFILEQNYPNPFNPDTKIRYTIPIVNGGDSKHFQYVTLKVYDILGNEVAVLINELQTAGSYEVDFQSSAGSTSLASGVYFYRLSAGPFGQAGSYTDTKKMILMK
jgi:hypothetical protein